MKSIFTIDNIFNAFNNYRNKFKNIFKDESVESSISKRKVALKYVNFLY